MTIFNGFVGKKQLSTLISFVLCTSKVCLLLQQLMASTVRGQCGVPVQLPVAWDRRSDLAHAITRVQDMEEWTVVVMVLLNKL